MHAMSVWQPFAALIVRGDKRIETRRWAAPSWLVGQRVGIHAAGGRVAPPDHPAWARVDGERLVRGALIGSAKLLGCVRIDSDFVVGPAERILGDFTEGNYAWLLDDPRALERPVKVTGQQGIFTVARDNRPVQQGLFGPEGDASARNGVVRDAPAWRADP